MKVSIMITCYNLRDEIDNAIQSVVDQLMPFDWELLIGDDGSTDGTIERIETWLKKKPNNVKMFVMERTSTNEKNGIRAARNRANLLEHAKGDYLIFLDGDDNFIGTDKIKRQVDLLEKNEYSKCSCCAHNIIANDIINKKKYKMANETIKQGVFSSIDYWPSMYFHTNTILFRKKCKQMMLDPIYRDYLNDNFITYIILQYGDIFYINEAMAQYNLIGNGLWTGKKRIYGCFRNLIVYDLEIKINPTMRDASFTRHLYDILYIFRYFTDYDIDDVTPLIDNLNPKIFSTTTLLYKRHNLSATERLAKIQLWVKAKILYHKMRIMRIMKKCIKKLGLY